MSKGSFTLCDFFLVATAILLMESNGLYISQWKCSEFLH